MIQRRYREHSVASWKKRHHPLQERYMRKIAQLSYGMGMGANTLIHNGRKP